jgi:transcriptional regulator with GAF, ATPase, and Fis domain
MKNSYQCEILERAAFQMTSSLDLEEVLTTITHSECDNESICNANELCLHLMASAGTHTNLDGEYRRIPLGRLHIGLIAKNKEALILNNILGDRKFPNQAWIKEQRIYSHAGYPLVFRNELLGVIAVFNRSEMLPDMIAHLEGFANSAAIAIKNAQLFAEVEQLKNRLQAENVYMQEEIKLIHNFEMMIGSSDVFRQVLQKVEQVAPTDATVLVRGESGTGKELIARSIHSFSLRKERPLVKLDCAALPSSLIENELFGHEKGAYTGAISHKIGRFELADGGSIFLDEIGDLPFELQSKLLRIIEEGEFEHVGGLQTVKIDVRIIAATNHDLEKCIENGTFREDLYYRLNVFPINIPPLRERKEDIPHLVRHFVRKYSEKLGNKIDIIPQKIMNALQAYHWPGNVRELENVIERAVILTRGNYLRIDTIGDFHVNEFEDIAGIVKLRDVERLHILRVLDETNWVIEGKHGAAARLDIHPATLRSRMQKLRIKRP